MQSHFCLYTDCLFFYCVLQILAVFLLCIALPLTALPLTVLTVYDPAKTGIRKSPKFFLNFAHFPIPWCILLQLSICHSKIQFKLLLFTHSIKHK